MKKKPQPRVKDSAFSAARATAKIRPLDAAARKAAEPIIVDAASVLAADALSSRVLLGVAACPSAADALLVRASDEPCSSWIPARCASNQAVRSRLCRRRAASDAVPILLAVR